MPQVSRWRLVDSPIRIFVLVLLLVFSAEGAIMLLLPQLPDAWHGHVTDGLLDASALTLLMAPVVWLLAVRPLRELSESRGHLLRRTFAAQEQERARVARELHDGLGQLLTTLLVGLKNVQMAPTLELASARARELRDVAAQAHGEVRRLSRDLRPLVLEELGFPAALERLCEEFERTHGVKTALDHDEALRRRLPSAVESVLYRIAQEALNNVARHAGAARVWIRLRRLEGSVTLSVADDGCGFSQARSPQRLDGEDGFGLVSMRERTQMLGGSLAVDSTPGRGTRIEVRIPLGEAA